MQDGICYSFLDAFVMFVSHTNTHQDTRQWVTHYGSANQEFADASFRRNEQKWVIIAGVLSRLSPIPLPFSLSPYPLPLSTSATQASGWRLVKWMYQALFFSLSSQSKEAKKKIITPDLRLGRPVTMKLTSREQRRLHQNFFKISKYKKITLRQTRHSQKPITE